MTVSAMPAGSSSTWHTISPSTRPLSLSILELTPLALTLSLTLATSASTSSFTSSLPSSSHLPTSSPSQHLHAHHAHSHHSHSHSHAHSPAHTRRKKRHPRRGGLNGFDSDEDTAVEADDWDHSSPLPGSWPLNGQVRFKDLLSHGVVVSVNGQVWSRVVAHVSDEDADDDHTASQGQGQSEGQGHASHGDHEGEAEDEWEDEPSSQVEGEGSTAVGGGEEGGITRRRPRKARFTLSAENAAKEAGLGDDKRRKERERQGERDRAVVVVYGLSPGKEYEIELRVVGMFGEGGDGIVSNAVLIPPSPSPNPTSLHPRSRANSLRSRSNPRSRSNSLNAPPDSPSPGRITPPMNGSELNPVAVAVPTPILSPNDAQAAQLRQLIAAAHAEKDHLQTQIKEARRASQRAEAALKVEIETVKKAIEKAGTMDMRAKQKALALQEQVKQGWAGAEAAEKETSDIEGGLADLERVLEEVRVELETVRDEWKVVRDREEEIREREKRAKAEEDKKLAEVVSKIDKLKAKKDKKEAEKAELEKRLEELEKQREEVERKNEEAKNRRGSGYWPQQGPHRSWDDHENHRLTHHPSLNNLSGHGGYGAGPAYRPRGGAVGYQPRFPSAGAVRPVPPAQPSPTHPNFFPPTSHATPNFRPPKPNPAASPNASTAGPNANVSASPAGPTRSPGVNVSAVPFHPSFDPAHSHHTTNQHHTTLMPPQLQHRIYLPNVRPRPAPNFHPPPSVMAERQSSPTNHSAPAFPPLPTVSGGNKRDSTIGGGSGSSGPSLASIVTRAVLSPTSSLALQAQQPQLASQGSQGQTPQDRRSPPPTGPKFTPTPQASISSTVSANQLSPALLPPTTPYHGAHRPTSPASSPTTSVFTSHSLAHTQGSNVWGLGPVVQRTSTPPSMLHSAGDRQAWAGRESPVDGVSRKSTE